MLLPLKQTLYSSQISRHKIRLFAIVQIAPNCVPHLERSNRHGRQSKPESLTANQNLRCQFDAKSHEVFHHKSRLLFLLHAPQAFLQAYASPAYERGIVAALGSHFGWRKLRPLIVRAVLRAFSRPFERGLLLVLELAPPQQESIQDRAGIAVSGTVTDAKEGALDKPSPGDENRGGKASEQANTERAEVARQALQAVVTEICAEEGDTVPVYGGREPKFALGNARVPMEYLQVVARFGWDACAPATETLVRKFVASPQSAVEFLAILATAFEKPERAAELEPKQRSLSLVAARFNAYFASELVDALHSEDESPQEMWMSPPSPRSLDFVYSLMLALNRLAFSAEKMVAVVSHFFATPKLYDLDKTLLPAVDSLLESLGSGYKGSPWFLKLYWGCLDALESRCLKPPQLDIWVLPAASACACWGCRILVQFCMDPLRVELQLRCPGRDAKQHLIDCVQR